MKPSHITVTAPDGRLTPIHPDDGVELGGGLLYVSPGKVARVRWSQTIRRAVARGDLAFCNMDASYVDSAEHARCDTEIDHEALRARKAARANVVPTPKKEGSS